MTIIDGEGLCFRKDEDLGVAAGAAPLLAGHTPGPWQAVQIRDGLWHVINDPHRVPIAVVDHSRDGHPPTRKQAEDDARLIAAAPDLLHAAKLALTIIEGLEHQTSESIDGNLLRAAIAKAEGR
jgi:hypothetical protein